MSAFPNDTELREILNDAHIPALLGTLAHATRDLKLLREEFRPNYIETAAGFQPQGGLSVSAQEKARDMAFDVILELRKGVHNSKPPLERNQIRQIMEYMVGPFSNDHFTLLLNELGLPEFNDVSKWHKSQLAADTDFTVAIIGAITDTSIFLPVALTASAAAFIAWS